MTIVKTRLKETKDKGIGLFADEFIPKNSLWWVEDTRFDKIISKAEYENANLLQKEFYDTYIFIKRDGTIYLCVDNARFINHSNNPNTDNIGDDCFVTRDIHPGEELTCDYRTICETCVNKLGFENKE
jgi:uncharacterized protein